jgi:hypothetical protein
LRRGNLRSGGHDNHHRGRDPKHYSSVFNQSAVILATSSSTSASVLPEVLDLVGTPVDVDAMTTLVSALTRLAAPPPSG